MRAMHTPLGMVLIVVGVILGYLLVASMSAAFIALTFFLVRRSRMSRSPPA
jgi:hypothetical protein